MTGSAAVAAAIGALLNLCEADILFTAESRFFKADGNSLSKIVAPLRTVSARAAATAEAAKAAAEDITEDISEIEAAKAAEATAARAVITLSRLRAVLIVTRFLFGIGKNGVSLVDFLEFFFRFLVARIHIGVIFLGKGAICFLISSSEALLETPRTS